MYPDLAPRSRQAGSRSREARNPIPPKAVDRNTACVVTAVADHLRGQGSTRGRTCRRHPSSSPWRLAVGLALPCHLQVGGQKRRVHPVPGDSPIANLEEVDLLPAHRLAGGGNAEELAGVLAELGDAGAVRAGTVIGEARCKDCINVSVGDGGLPLPARSPG